MSQTEPPSASGLDFGRGFSFFFEDPDWIKKALLGGLFALLGAMVVGIFFLAGYWVRLVRRVAAGEARPLPEWEDLGGIFSDGLKVVGVYFVLAFSMLAVFGLVFGVLVLFAAGAGLVSQSSEALGSLMGLVAGLGMVACYGLFLLLAVLLALYLPAALLRVALLDRFGEAFAVRANLLFIKANLGNYLLTLGLYLIASVATQFGMLLCCVGIFPVSFWSYCVLGWGLGETARLGPDPV
jgi:hypothetical protein